MFSKVLYVTVLLYLYSYLFSSPRRRFILQTEISGKYIQLLVFFISFLSQSLLLAVRVSLPFLNQPMKCRVLTASCQLHAFAVVFMLI